MVEFLPNEVQARVILLQGDAFIVSFPSSHNFHSGGHFVKLMSAMFDRFAPTADKVTIDNIKRINAELYLADYEMIGNICPDQDKHEERKRIGQQIIDLRKTQKMDGKTLAARVGSRFRHAQQNRQRPRRKGRTGEIPVTHYPIPEYEAGTTGRVRGQPTNSQKSFLINRNN